MAGPLDVASLKPEGPVEFDFDAARELASRFKASGDLVLAQQMPKRRQLASTARKDWKGKYAGLFDTRMNQCDGDAKRLDEALKDAAKQVEQLADAARREQERRDRANAYLVEHAAWRERQRTRAEWDVDSFGDLWDIATSKLDKEPVMPDMTGEPPSLPIKDPAIRPRDS